MLIVDNVPREVFPMWRRAQLEFGRHSREALLSPYVLRTAGFLSPELAERVTEWFMEEPARPRRPSGGRTGRSSARPRGCSTSPPGLGVRVQYVRDESEPTRAPPSCAPICASTAR